MNVTEYVNYWRQMAVKHKSLAHNPQSENEDHPTKGERRFARFSDYNLIKGLRTEISEDPVLLLHIYDWRMGDNGSLSYKNYHTGIFMVMQKAKVNDIASQELAYETTEKIVKGIVAKMVLDQVDPEVKCHLPFHIEDFNSIKVDAEGPAFDNRFGWVVQFNFMQPWKIEEMETIVSNDFL